MKALHLIVSGRVQGVGYRWTCATEAQHLGVTGWVRNLDDGRVEVHVEGEDAAVDGLLDWCRQGPNWAQVNGVEVTAVPVEGLGRFQVR